jgi:hypothetical protein
MMPRFSALSHQESGHWYPITAAGLYNAAVNHCRLTIEGHIERAMETGWRMILS